MAPIVRAAVNNAIRDPLQGFDADVYVQDQATGKQIMVGRFTSFQWTVRNATEPYMEFRQRVPRLLDGEYQFGWVMERGLIDTRLIEDTFGLSYLGRELRLGRSPRFQITVVFDAPDLDELSSNNFIDSAALNKADSVLDLGFSSSAAPQRTDRKSRGMYRLIYAKTDALTVGMMAGRSVIANRWEGLCEGIAYKDLAENEGLATTSLGGVTAYSPSVNGLSGNNVPGSFAALNNTVPDWSTLF